jgi:hypothetical protein
LLTRQGDEVDLDGLRSATAKGRELDAVDLRMDVESLLTAGATVEEILKALNLGDSAIQFVEYLRQRRDVPERPSAE